MAVFRRRVVAATGLCSVVIATAAGGAGLPRAALGASPPTYSVADVGASGGTPSTASNSRGQLYETTPEGGTLTYTSTDRGTTWKKVTTADPKSGDDCLATDQSNSVYLCNLAGTPGALPLQADVWKSVNHGASWTQGKPFLPPVLCGTSCSPFGVDRQWVAASILPPATSTSQAEVVLMYHDFYGPSQIWVNISHDGGATFGAPQNVLASAALTPGAITATVGPQPFPFCNPVPAGVGIAPPGTPHAGRIFVAWIAADPVQNGTGCNVSMLQSFHNLFVSYSDNGGTTWTPQL